MDGELFTDGNLTPHRGARALMNLAAPHSTIEQNVGRDAQPVSEPPASDRGSAFVARQPILDKNQRVFAYEMLFRSSGSRTTSVVLDGDAATSEVLASSMFTIGIKEILGDKRGFFNFTREHLFTDYSGILDPRQIVIEVLETVIPDEDVIAACRRLKAGGFLLALDDFCPADLNNPLVSLADFIKVDFRLTEPAQQKALAAHFVPRGITMLAEKVETVREFEAGRRWGYSLFQGYYFARPEIIRGKRVPESKRLYHQLLCALNEPELDINKIEAAIKYDLSLTYKLLLFMNSAQFGFLSRVESVRQAIVLLGEKRLRTWVSLALVASMGADKPQELIVTGAFRAHFCERLGKEARINCTSGSLFLLGLFSVMDAVMGMPMKEVLAGVHLDEEVLATLLGAAAPDSRMSKLYTLVLAYETAAWQQVSSLSSELGIHDEEIPDMYKESMQWTSRLFAAESR